jgi:hypothetical protein
MLLSKLDVLEECQVVVEDAWQAGSIPWQVTDLARCERLGNAPNIEKAWVPVGSLPKSPFIGSHTTNGRALLPPPVKSVIGVHTE